MMKYFVFALVALASLAMIQAQGSCTCQSLHDCVMESKGPMKDCMEGCVGSFGARETAIRACKNEGGNRREGHMAMKNCVANELGICTGDVSIIEKRRAGGRGRHGGGRGKGLSKFLNRIQGDKPEGAEDYLTCVQGCRAAVEDQGGYRQIKDQCMTQLGCADVEIERQEMRAAYQTCSNGEEPDREARRAQHMAKCECLRDAFGLDASSVSCEGGQRRGGGRRDGGRRRGPRDISSDSDSLSNSESSEGPADGLLDFLF